MADQCQRTATGAKPFTGKNTVNTAKAQIGGKTW